jgi:hypothetical protein
VRKLGVNALVIGKGPAEADGGSSVHRIGPAARWSAALTSSRKPGTISGLTQNVVIPLGRMTYLTVRARGTDMIGLTHDEVCAETV